MATQIMQLHAQIVRFVQEHWPSIVACEFVDAAGHSHTFIGKDVMFTETSVDAQSVYPQPGSIRCTVLGSWHDGTGRELVRVCTAYPDDLESTEEVNDFVVLRDRVSPWSVQAKV
jgi:hypothetical protein